MALASFGLRHSAVVAPDAYILRLSCNCDGSSVAAATSENSVLLLDPAAGLRTTRSLVGHGDVVEDIGFFQADPFCLASCSRDGSTRVWDVRTPDAARSFSVSGDEVYSCSVGRGDSALACASSEKVHLFDIARGKRICVYKDSHTDVVNHVRFHPVDSTKLLSGSEDNLVVILDTSKANQDDALLAVIPNEECVRSFTLVGPTRETLCCASTTEDVRIWGLGAADLGMKRAEFLGLRAHPLLAREESPGYIVEMFYDEPSGQVFLLAGAGDMGDLALFRVTLAEAQPVATFAPHSEAGADGDASSAVVHTGHSGIVRSALCMPGGVIITAGEDGRVCSWHEALQEVASGDAATRSFGLEPSSYAVSRARGGAAESRAAAAPY